MLLLDQPWFSRISRPSRYLGCEVNVIKKNPNLTEVSVALAFPDIYEVGMSHLGLKILYHILNSHHWLAAERVFAPWVDLEEQLRHYKVPLSTLESDRPLSDFDVVGFSLQHELSYTNVLNMLDLSGISFLATERDEEDPLIIAGGPGCFNPEPVADFFDLMVIGDGEEAILKICKAIRDGKHNKIKNRKELLHQFCRIKGVYVPSFFSVRYERDGRVHTIEPLLPDYPIVEKAIVPDIEDYPFPDRQVVPFAKLVHDRLAIEIFRGCTRGCRFCQAGMIYRPVRERSPESIINKVQKGLELTGYEEITLLSLSSGDYGCIGHLLMALADRLSSGKVPINLPSLRADSLDTSWISQLKRVKKTGFTLAPEAGNDRLRRIINKGLTQEAILETARAIYEAGWNLIKLYFMVGLPFEEEEDIQDIIRLAKQIKGMAGKKGKRARLNIHISTFVPKSHTPFMWVSQIPLEESRRRMQLILKQLSDSSLHVKWNHPEVSWVEGVFSRGDRRLSKVLIEAWKLGAKFDSWGEHFQMETWQQAFQLTGIDPGFFLYRERSLDEILPWDHIKSGVNKDFFKREWERAQMEKLTPDCRKKCLECGVCDHQYVDPILFEECSSLEDLEKTPVKNAPALPKTIRLTFTKLERAKFLGHLELVRVFVRALRRAGLNIVYSGGFHPMPKVSFASALPVGTESMQETVDIEITESTDLGPLKDSINRQLPSGITITAAKEISISNKKERLKETHFIITVKGVKLKKGHLERFLESDYFPVVKVTKKGEHEVNARPLVRSMSLDAPNRINLAIRHTSGPGLKSSQIVKGVFSLNDSQLNDMRILKIGQVLG